MIRSLLVGFFVAAAVATAALAVLNNRQAPAADAKPAAKSGPGASAPESELPCFNCTVPVP